MERNGQPPILRLDRLSKAFREAGKERTVLDELSREFVSGEFVCLLGKSGSGKSTLLNLISGVDKPTIWWVARPVTASTPRAKARSAELFARSIATIIATPIMTPITKNAL